MRSCWLDWGDRISVFSPRCNIARRKRRRILRLPRTRDALVSMRTQLINPIRGVVKSFATRLPSCTSDCFHKKTLEVLPPELQSALGPLYQVLGQVLGEADKQLREYDKRIDKLAKKYPEVQALQQI